MKYKVLKSLGHTFKQKSLTNLPSKIWTFQVLITMEAIYVRNPEKNYQEIFIFLNQADLWYDFCKRVGFNAQM